MRRITIDGQYKMPIDWRGEEISNPEDIIVDSCQMHDRYMEYIPYRISSWTAVRCTTGAWSTFRTGYHRRQLKDAGQVHGVHSVQDIIVDSCQMHDRYMEYIPYRISLWTAVRCTGTTYVFLTRLYLNM